MSIVSLSNSSHVLALLPLTTNSFKNGLTIFLHPKVASLLVSKERISIWSAILPKANKSK